jgi:hypothetical protein
MHKVTRRYSCTSTDGLGTMTLPIWSWAGWTGQKVWTPPFTFAEESLVQGQYKADIQDLEVCQENTSNLNDCLPETLERAQSILSFTARWLAMSELISSKAGAYAWRGYYEGFYKIHRRCLPDRETTLICLGPWRDSGKVNKYEMSPPEESSWCSGSGDGVYMCLVVKWIDSQQTVCEGVGIGFVASRIWKKLAASITGKQVCLA